MTVTARMRVEALKPLEYGEGKQLLMSAVYSDDPASPNYSFSQATPNGQLLLTITNPAAFDQFEVGKTYDLSIVEYVEPLPVVDTSLASDMPVPADPETAAALSDDPVSEPDASDAICVPVDEIPATTEAQVVDVAAEPAAEHAPADMPADEPVATAEVPAAGAEVSPEAAPAEAVAEPAPLGSVDTQSY